MSSGINNIEPCKAAGIINHDTSTPGQDSKINDDTSASASPVPSSPLLTHQAQEEQDRLVQLVTTLQKLQIPPPPPAPPAPVATTPASCSSSPGTSWWQYLSIGNLFKLFLLWEVLVGATDWIWPAGGGTQNNNSGMKSIHRPIMEQHFTFEPVGYNYMKPGIGGATGPNQAFKTSGYYQKDVMAVMQAAGDVLLPKAKEAEESLEKEEFPASIDWNLIPGRNNSHYDHAGTTGSKTVTTIVIELNLGANPQREITFLRHAATFLLGFHQDSQSISLGRSELEVMVMLNSNGGSISAYGLLADQLRRLRTAPGITLTITCDQAALSGGYMLAVLASPGHLLAAPFASIGSIGAKTTDVLNIHEALKQWGVKPIQFKGGKWKDPMNMFADVSEDEMEYMQRHIDYFHEAFSQHVQQWRGDSINDYEVATSGAYWLGAKAHELGLVDHLITSDEYIDEKLRSGDRVLRMKKNNKNQDDKKKGWLSFLLDLILRGSSSGEDDGIDSDVAASVGSGGSFAVSIVRILKTILEQYEHAG